MENPKIKTIKKIKYWREEDSAQRCKSVTFHADGWKKISNIIGNIIMTVKQLNNLTFIEY